MRINWDLQTIVCHIIGCNGDKVALNHGWDFPELNGG
jgi:hypothetical protein